MGRLHSLEALGLVSDHPHLRLDSITALAATVLDAPISLTTVLQPDLDRQFFSASCGLPDDLAVQRETPFDHAICRFVAQADDVVRISDLSRDPRTADNPLVIEHGLRSYIGAPIHTAGGRAIGALCCLTTETRLWTQQEGVVLQQLAACVDDLIQLASLRIEEQRAHQRLQAIARARSGFIAHISHELRTPLTGIIGSIRLLDRFNLDSTAGDLIRLLNRSSQRLMDILNDTLDLSKIDSGAFQITHEICNIEQIVADIVADHVVVAQEKPLVTRWGSTLKAAHYLADRKSLHSVLDNLFANAVRFTTSGSAEIQLSEDSYGHVVIKVIDTGQGIDPVHLANLFDEFEKAGPRVARKCGGTGLGMAMVRRLVELMDGDIAVESVRGQGTTLTITLPLQAVDTADFMDVTDIAPRGQSRL